VGAGLDEIVVSLDGLQPVHDTIRGPGMYQAAINGIQALLRCRDGGSTGLPRVKVNYCISGSNCEGLSGFAARMLDRIGVDVVGFTHLNFVTEELSRLHNGRFAGEVTATPLSTGVDPNRVDTDALWGELLEIYRRFEPARVIFDVHFREKELLEAHYRSPGNFAGRHPCAEPWMSATMRANGDFLIRSRCIPYVAGNIREQTFGQIWRGERYRVFRRILKKEGFFPICARCCGSL